MQGIRYLDKLIDELAKGRPMEKILRKQCRDRGASRGMAPGDVDVLVEKGVVRRRRSTGK
jgi:hypothetical protein